MAEILDVLGWKFARSGSKAHPFASAFDVLGVSIDLSKLYEGIVTLKNKQSRVDALVAAIDRLVYEGRVESGVAASLHGQLNELCTGFRYSCVSSAGWQVMVGLTTSNLMVACLFARDVLTRSQPREISLTDDDRPILFFLDACPAGAGVCGVGPGMQNQDSLRSCGAGCSS